MRRFEVWQEWNPWDIRKHWSRPLRRCQRLRPTCSDVPLCRGL